MKLNFCQQTLKWSSVVLSCATMVFSPLAMGKEAEQITKAQISNAIAETGLQKKQTVGQFWAGVKDELPGYMYQDMKKVFEANKNLAMPEVSTSSLKGANGQDVQVVRLTQAGRTDTLQFFGEKDKFVKYNGVTLTEYDLQHLQDAVTKIEATDYNLKKEGDAYRQQNFKNPKQSQFSKDFARFRGFPRVTPVMWKSMTRTQRAGYLVRMRMMWQSAQEVKARAPASSKVVPPAKKSKKTAEVENFLQVIFGQNAYAASGDVSDGIVVGGAERGQAQPRRRGTSSTPSGDATTARVAAASTGDCVVAGYIGTYAPNGANSNGRNRTVCNVQRAIEKINYSTTLSFVEEANAKCAATKGAGFVACNPVIYGYSRTATEGSAVGDPICLARMDASFQIATTFPGACDVASKLNSSEFDPKAITRADQISKVEDEQRADGYSQTKAFLDSILVTPKGARASTNLDAVLNGAWNQDLDTELVGIQQRFEAEINEAASICEGVSYAAGQADRNSGPACDQLHRRWLFTEKFVADFRQKGCLDGSTYTGSYNGEKVSGSFVGNVNKTVYANEAVCRCPDGGSGGPPPPPPPADSGGSGPPPVRAGSGAPASPDPTVASTASTTPGNGKLVSIGQTCNSEPPPVVVVPPPEPPPGLVCKLKGKHIKSMVTCECEDKYTKNDAGTKCEGGGLSTIAKVAIGVGVLALIACVVKFCKGKKKDPPPTTPPGCPEGSGKIKVASVCVCPAGFTENAQGVCTKDPDPPVVVCLPPLTIPPGGTCSCNVTCTAPNQVLDAVACQCKPVTVDPPVTCTAPKVPSSDGKSCVCAITASSCSATQDYNAGSCSCVDRNEGGTGTNPNDGDTGGVPTGH